MSNIISIHGVNVYKNKNPRMYPAGFSNVFPEQTLMNHNLFKQQYLHPDFADMSERTFKYDVGESKWHDYPFYYFTTPIQHHNKYNKNRPPNLSKPFIKPKSIPSRTYTTNPFSRGWLVGGKDVQASVLK